MKTLTVTIALSLVIILIIGGTGCNELTEVVNATPTLNPAPPLELVSVTTEVSPGDTFELVVKTDPEVYVWADAIGCEGIYEKTRTDSAGIARWACMLPESINPGTHKIRVVAQYLSWEELSNPMEEERARLDVMYVVKE